MTQSAQPEILFYDSETYSEVDIRKGTDNYARSAEIMLHQYALNDGPVQYFDATTGDRMPAFLEDKLLDDRVLKVAHNASFDRQVLLHNGFDIPLSAWYCTMAQALAHSLPGGLDKLCEIFNIAEDKAKIKDGKALIQLFCKPRPKKQKLRRATRETHPDEWARFIEYGVNDIEAMREVHRKMPKWNYPYEGREIDLWRIDQAINQRGVTIDVPLVEMALTTADRVKLMLSEEAQEMTAGALTATTQRDAMLKFLVDQYDIRLENARASTLENILKTDDNLPQTVRELLLNRLAASSTSVSKYASFAKLTGPDGRLRNTLQFCGAMRTGRWAGRGVQLQNLPRPVMKNKAIEAGIEAIKCDAADLIYENPMELLSSAVRGVIVPPDGKKLSVADLSNIEGRMLAWLAGESWKLDAFRLFDTCKGKDGEWYTGDQIRDAVLARRPIALDLDRKGEPIRAGHDLYALAYAKAFGVSPEAVMDNKANGDGSWRQIGKVMELALGYEGGVGAFVTFALDYGINLDDMARDAWNYIPPAVLEKAGRAYEWAKANGRDFGLLRETYIVCDAFKRLWRTAHPATSSLWKGIENGFRAAVLSPSKVFTVRGMRIVKQGVWARIVLPSGRSLCYPSPRLSGEGEKISYMGINQFSRQWNRIETYSGKLAENVTQAASRDVLAWNLPDIERAGYAVVSLVHDEDITEAPDDVDHSADHLAAIMSKNPPWSVGLPLAAAGFDAYRYRKD